MHGTVDGAIEGYSIKVSDGHTRRRRTGTDAAPLASQRMTRAYRTPDLLADHHDVTVPVSLVEQTERLRRYARRSAAPGKTRVFVVTEHHGRPGCRQLARARPTSTRCGPSRVRKGAGR